MTAFEQGLREISPHENIITYETPIALNKVLQTPISYGVLRGTGEIFKNFRSANRDFWEIDRGYFKPAHFDGYYRISRNGMRVKYFDSMHDTKRFDELDIVVSPWKNGGKYVLFCPPSDEVVWFYNLPHEWALKQIRKIQNLGFEVKRRDKSDANNLPLEWDLEQAICVVTWNSNVAINSLLSGVPAICYADEDVKNWNNLSISDIGKSDLTAFDRRQLFSFLANNQFTLNEFKTGQAWESALKTQQYGEV